MPWVNAPHTTPRPERPARASKAKRKPPATLQAANVNCPTPQGIGLSASALGWNLSAFQAGGKSLRTDQGSSDEFEANTARQPRFSVSRNPSVQIRAVPTSRSVQKRLKGLKRKSQSLRTDQGSSDAIS